MEKIKFKIDTVAKRRGIKNAYGLQEELKCSPTLAARLWKNSFKQIGIETIERLCDLFDCVPQDLFDYEPKNKPAADIKPASKGEPLKSVVREKTAKTKLPVLPDGDAWITTEEIAERLGLSKKSVTDYINKKNLPSWQAAKRTPHYVKESDYPAFEAYYRNLTGKSKS
jgi:DNA-binding Xre family transcriptional regulator/DNA-binding XRE family transcriptional regulator